MSEARSWSDTTLCAADSRQDKVAVFSTRGRGRLPVIEGIDWGGIIGYQGNQQRSTPPHCPFDKLSISLWR